MDPSPSLRVLTLNIGSLWEPDWDKRRHLIVAGIRELEPDVVCLQEVCHSEHRPNTGRWITQQLGEPWHYAFGGFPVGPDDPTHFGSAILSRWAIDDEQVHRLPVGPGAAGMLAQMGWELLHVRTAGLDIFSTHLAAAPTDQPHRLLQVQAIDDIIRATRGTLDHASTLEERDAMPPILCGDFNAEPDSDEIRFLSSLTSIDGRSTFYQDAWRTAGDGSPGLTNDWRLGELAGLLNVHRKRIDYVFVGDPFLRHGYGGRVLSCNLAFNEAQDGLMASDHCGVVVDIVWPTRPS